MKVMIHKIHMGFELPSVQAGKPYQIIGFNNSVNDYSEVEFPAEGPNNCQFCHAPATQPNPPPANANAWLMRPSRAACGSCHDNVNFATGQNHANLAQISDNLCGNCHFAQGEVEFDISIIGAHAIPRFSAQLPGVVLGINSITNGAAGQNPQVTFTLKDKSGAVIPASSMNTLNLILAYPTTDYLTAITESARAATANPDGSFTYTFKAAVPAGTKGTGTIGLEGYRNQTVMVQATPTTVRDVGRNIDVDFSIDGSSPVTPRRAIVSTEKCNQCHYSLQAHGTIRNEIKHCVLCHNPNATDTPFRPADQQPAQGIDFAMMTHRIHTGDEQESDYTIYGFGGNAFDFKNIGFPGDRRDCEKCHLTDTQQLPPKAILPVVNPRGFITLEGPTQAACLGCHTDQASAAHASLNASPALGEACSVCHGPDADFSVDRVHAR
jgi:OmcA/MtrC family decaheme c-type cytochrome